MPIARIRMPRMGTSVHESTVVEWKKGAGDRVAKGEVLLSAESDKVEFQVESPADGVLKEVLVAPEATVPVGEVLALLETEEEIPDAQPEAPSGPPRQPAGDWTAPVAPLPPRRAPVIPARPPAAQARRAVPGQPGGWLSPRVQRIAAGHGVPLGTVIGLPGTGAGGRVTARDLERFIQAGGGAAPAVTLLFRPLAEASEARERREPLSRLRKRIAGNLARSAAIPQASLWMEVDMSRIAAWREANKERFRERHGAALSYAPFFALAIIHALRDPAHARLNARFEEEALLVARYVNLGIAVDTPEGLVVPVLREADRMGFVELVRALDDLGARARAGKLTPGDMAGGTLTLTNFGASGARGGIPLLNPPEVAIVGTGAVAPRAAALPGGGVGVLPLMTLSMSFDHRANDGMAAGRFAAAIRAALEGMDLSHLES
ncbi:MAG: 2-oxo acid dehydrogenase subunit E2 [Candidatus Tectomicrobia bacterium]|nr:2-oxo acid dehydrogenase subunit E2 [Candidatus Tectomicrobia bacterium]